MVRMRHWIQNANRIRVHLNQSRGNIARFQNRLPLCQYGTERFFRTSAILRQDDADQVHEFKAETTKLLDIVTNSIYTDKEVFLRELVSNASDALEKFRHLSVTGTELQEPNRTLEIRIKTDKENGTLIIEDTGIGMTAQDMKDNLGTIARSGSKAFVESLGDADSKKNVIGQFGVGFYSAFMVGHRVDVYSTSAIDGTSHIWSSAGTDSYTLKPAPEFKGPGSRVVIHLRDQVKEEYTNASNVQSIIAKYSNYVGFPIMLNDVIANQVDAIWSRDPSKITQEEYEEFYRYNADAFDSPMYTLHFKTDVPIDMKALVFVPTHQGEKQGMGRLPPGVSLYSRRVLLESKSQHLLPFWLRFVKGVVDSEDLPINLSRESMQDSRLLQNIKKALTRRVIKLFKDKAKQDPKAYNETFFKEFGKFLKEGICTDPDSKVDLSKLVRFNSSAVGPTELTSLDEYISRAPPTQKEIYFLLAPNRRLAETSPYFEMFKKKNIEVLFLYLEIDEFVMGNIFTYEGRQLLSAGAKDHFLDENGKTAENIEPNAMNEQDCKAVIDLFTNVLGDSVLQVTATDRLTDSPAMVVGFESAALRRMMKMVQQESMEDDKLPKQNLGLNMNHPIIRKIHELHLVKPDIASALVHQIFDNALIAAGLVEDPRSILPRLNLLIEKLLEVKPNDQ